jgi:signal peptidase I
MTKAKPGDIVVFDKPIEFLDGKIHQELRFIKQSQFLEPVSGQGYHIVSWRNYPHTIKGEGE